MGSSSGSAAEEGLPFTGIFTLPAHPEITIACTRVADFGLV